MSTVNLHDMVDTWNDGATNFRAIRMNVTNTASGAGSLLMEMLLNGDHRLSLSRDGVFLVSNQVQAPSVLASSGTGAALNSNGVWIGSNDAVRFASTSSPLGSVDVVLRRDAAAALSQRNGTAPQVFRVYNTWTNTSNYERGIFSWESNALRIGTEQAGTGGSRGLNIVTAGQNRITVEAWGDVLVSSSFRVESGNRIQWQGRTAMFSPANGLLRLTNDAANDFNRLEFGGGTNAFPAIKRNGNRLDARLADDSAFAPVAAANYIVRDFDVNISGSPGVLSIVSANATQFRDVRAASFGWGNDLVVVREAADTLAQRRGTNPQTFRVYNGYTDASNWERGFFGWTSSTLELASEAAGTGTVRPIRLRVGNTVAVLSSTSGWQVQGELATTTGHIRNSGFTRIHLSGSDGVVTLFNNAQTDFNRLQFGGTTSAFPSIKRNGTSFAFRLADDSNYTDIEVGDNIFFGSVASSPRLRAISSNLDVVNRGANSFSPLRVGELWFSADVRLGREDVNVLGMQRGTSPQAFRIYNTYTNASNYERGFAGWNSNQFRIGTEHLGTGVARPISFYTNGLERLRIAADGSLTYGKQSVNEPPFETCTLQVGDPFGQDMGLFSIICRDYTGEAFPNASLTLNPEEGAQLQVGTGSLGVMDSVVSVQGTAFSNSEIIPQNASMTLGRVVLGTYRPIATAFINSLFLHNSYTDGANWERGAVTWVSNVLEIFTQRSGTGSARPIIFRTNGAGRFQIGGAGTMTFTVAASQNFIITGLPTANPNVAGALWNDAGTLKVSAG